jgi:hypothetical protein
LQQKDGHRSGKCPGFSPDELLAGCIFYSAGLIIPRESPCIVSEMVVAFQKNEFFDIFLLSILKNCSRRMKHKKNITSNAKGEPNL